MELMSSSSEEPSSSSSASRARGCGAFAWQCEKALCGDIQRRPVSVQDQTLTALTFTRRKPSSIGGLSLGALWGSHRAAVEDPLLMIVNRWPTALAPRSQAGGCARLLRSRLIRHARTFGAVGSRRSKHGLRTAAHSAVGFVLGKVPFLIWDCWCGFRALMSRRRKGDLPSRRYTWVTISRQASRQW